MANAWQQAGLVHRSPCRGNWQITSIAWLKQPSDCVVAANSKGRLAVFSQGIFRCFLAVEVSAEGVGGVYVASLTPLMAGLVLGCSDGSFLYLTSAGEERVGEPEMYQVRKGRGERKKNAMQCRSSMMEDDVR